MICEVCGEDKPKEREEKYPPPWDYIVKPCKACLAKAQEGLKNYPLPLYMRKPK